MTRLKIEYNQAQVSKIMYETLIIHTMIGLTARGDDFERRKEEKEIK